MTPEEAIEHLQKSLIERSGEPLAQIDALAVVMGRFGGRSQARAIQKATAVIAKNIADFGRDDVADSADADDAESATEQAVAN